MTVYAWPTAWRAARFEMRVMPNLRTFTGPYTPTTQVLDLLGERWMARIDLPLTVDSITAAAREAFFDRLKGQAHQVSLWHLRLPAPQGTLRDGATGSVINGSLAAVSVVNGSSAAVTVVYGTPVLAAAVSQLANTATIRTIPARTLRAGDLLGISDQLVRIMEDTTADGTGLMSIEFQPRARSAWAIYTVPVWNKPTADFMLSTTDGVPTVWSPGMAESASFDFVEVV